MLSVLWVKMYRELWQKKILVLTLSLVLMIASGHTTLTAEMNCKSIPYVTYIE